MVYTVSITSQGQMSIPADIRRTLGLSVFKKALVSIQDGKMVVEPVKDFLSLGGSLKTEKKASSKQIREAFQKYLAQEAVSSLE
ncbi:hypothetical protein A3D00_04435 [Candidatus Woesebacteria bacterium RIFCSPHIGHO2_02_FULL_38_9]|uniref:SpoVT-AbrB domain-containing protein n=1 Tax=Candidatus Woesebacteria bacterium RIFCSPHIGHO2_01_FULL_39_28 TaxID=1802496 RepID=A0A1F7YGC2_9BACT|nr:MAG: hypothetical protein A2627_05790 [Candidatus Woesebacteria bacterium RIFCSPHIGHO2_01_FULL_39_28]OGM34939.1 MAG: hypothetical protein A3D00_04435 [Candidatus Woesebacteria bacterium RIFCSPHIGHO2_02_FULL_38_9]OGM57458.1 MAG: hypothetical protein A3A50_06015 [Candidatus Woesebacteria bacterium RIFCSPLOWO2_01_FULL_38_20]